MRVSDEVANLYNQKHKTDRANPAKQILRTNMTNKDIPKLSRRLSAAASYARAGAHIADIGTDHAYLPIYLYKTCRVPGGVASDINEGPVARARQNIRAYGAEAAIATELCNGLSAVQKYSPDDIFILGMGGELIVSIIDGAPWVKAEDIHLILQPMTHPEILREYLYKNGFAVIDECVVRDDKLYQIIVAQYIGEQTAPAYDECELLFGRLNIERESDEYLELLAHVKNVYAERKRGKDSAFADSAEETRIIEKIEQLQFKAKGGESI